MANSGGGFVAAPLPAENLHKVLKYRKNETENSQAILDRLAKLQECFPQWFHYLCDGFGVLLHGFGSKRELIQKFCEEILAAKNVPHLILRGYLPNLQLKSALSTLAGNLNLCTGAQSTDICELANAIVSSGSGNERTPHCVLVVHSIDGMCLRDQKCQSALATLASAPFIRIIASIDHVNASLLWDQSMLSRFRWLWIDASTYHSYEAELLASDSRILSLHATRGQTYAHSMASLESLWASLTENARRLLALIARLCLAAGSGLEVSFWHVFRLARDDLIVSSELAMRQQMVEFHDHHLVSTGKGNARSEVGECVKLLVDKKLLAAFLSAQGFDEFATEAENCQEKDASDCVNAKTD